MQPVRASLGLATVNWRLLGTAALWTLNGVGLAIIAVAFFAADVGFDWELYVEAGRRFQEGNLYDWGPQVSFRYSPVLAGLFAVIAPIGYVGWTALHFASLLTLPRRLALLCLASFPFWADIYNGNTMTFVVVSAVAGLRGNRLGAVIFLTLAMLMPRPLMLPIAIYLLWRMREIIPIFAVVLIAHATAVVASGWGEAWIANLVTRGADDLGSRGDFGPSLLFGPWWYPVGLASALFLLVRRRFGLASLAASPYWLSHYFLVLVLEAVPSTGERREAAVNEHGAPP